MDGRDPVVMQAIRNIMEHHSNNEWWALSASQRTQAIYDEIKRLDAKGSLSTRRIAKPAVEMA